MIKAGIYKHIKTGNLYKVIPIQVKIKDNGEWIEGVQYHRKDEDSQYFVRSEEIFKKKFVYEGL
jgi:hypothetical protein